ncbi:farnesol dehydrogenase [Flavobacterium fluvii]|uniref:Farnesol dehydrogenase n=1 Tax=Flavobacterium fluvii TaxID=468056 RepID=A0A1M5KDR5_9FLAO|nr:NAD-dependent epimerase/dehydratase family protein [Flavobacterium fluvii]SHG50619.1 farnesol dehydrogenase [Flavobacterium fluvii]
MKILITGATGYVGHRLALTLAERNNEVHILVRNPDSHNIPQHKNIKIFAGDITDKQSMTPAIKECKQVYHTAALVKAFDKDATLFYKVNVEGTRNLLESALETGVEKFVFTSSCSVIGPTLNTAMCENDERISPLDNDYDATKYLAENLVKEYGKKGLHTVIVSPSKVFGPSGLDTKSISVNKIINRFIKGEPTFIPKPGKLIANFCFIDDVVEGHILAMSKGNVGENYILGGENISFSEFFQTIGALSEKKRMPIEIPRFVMKIFSMIQWLQFKATNQEPLITENSIRQIYCNKIFSSEKAIRKLGYQITPLREGLQQTIHFLKNQRYEN